jgi:hypothetical protein
MEGSVHCGGLMGCDGYRRDHGQGASWRRTKSHALDHNKAGLIIVQKGTGI